MNVHYIVQLVSNPFLRSKVSTWCPYYPYQVFLFYQKLKFLMCSWFPIYSYCQGFSLVPLHPLPDFSPAPETKILYKWMCLSAKVVYSLCPNHSYCQRFLLGALTSLTRFSSCLIPYQIFILHQKLKFFINGCVYQLKLWCSLCPNQSYCQRFLLGALTSLTRFSSCHGNWNSLINKFDKQVWFFVIGFRFNVDNFYIVPCTFLCALTSSARFSSHIGSWNFVIILFIDNFISFRCNVYRLCIYFVLSFIHFSMRYINRIYIAV